LRLVVQNDIQQRAVDLEATVVVDEAQLAKFVHEEAHARPPIISASVSWLIFAIIGSGAPSLPKFANSRSKRASRFSLELKS
jgi:hypothetical protein